MFVEDEPDTTSITTVLDGNVFPYGISYRQSDLILIATSLLAGMDDNFDW